VVEELCKDAKAPPACDHPAILCEAGNVKVDYVENYCQGCNSSAPCMFCTV